jgi:hypothetical protein
MKKMRAERPSNPQQSHLGVESNGSIAVDAATTTGAVCTIGAGRMMSGCVFVMFTAGLGAPAGFGRIAIRAVSFFGPGWIEAPLKFSEEAGSVAFGRASEAADFGSGCNKGDVLEAGGCIGGRRNGITGDSAEGAMPIGVVVGLIVGGSRRGGTAGVREGRTILAVSRVAPLFCGLCVVSGLGGSAMRIVSFFGSAMTGHVAPRKIAEISFLVTR